MSVEAAVGARAALCAFARITFAATLAASALVGCNGTLAFTDPDGGIDAGAVVETGPPSCVDAGCPLATLRCEGESGLCVECLSSGDCGPPFRWCDPDQHRCFECSSTADCFSDSVCIVPAHKCAPRCPPAGGDCPSNSMCDPVVNACVFCSGNGDCSLDPEHHVCRLDVGNCFECAQDGDCGGAHPFCDPASFRCVSCLQSSDCPTARPFCDPTHHSCVSG